MLNKRQSDFYSSYLLLTVKYLNPDVRIKQKIGEETMIRTIKAEERHLVDKKAQHSYWLFSYADYVDMQNPNFGDIRVFNDITLKSGKAFKLESVDDKEIVTIVLDGEFNHEDSTGSNEILKTGDVQVMSSGNGVSFSGMNTSGSDTHLCRIWIQPLRHGMDATCKKENFDAGSRINELMPIASGQGFKEALKLRANATVYLSKLAKGKMVDLLTDSSRYVLVYVLEGEVTVCGEKLGQYDQARLNQNETVLVEADIDAYFILVDAAGNS